MKKFLGFALILVLSIALAACGSEKDKSGSDTEKESKKIVVGASNVPHAEILEEAKPLLKEKRNRIGNRNVPGLYFTE